MKRRRIQRVVILLTAPAVVAGFCICRQYRVPPTPILQQRIAAVHLNNVPEKKAIEEVAALTGTKIKVLGELSTNPLSVQWYGVSIDFRDVTVEQTIEALVENLKFNSSGRLDSYEVAGNEIVIAAESALPHRYRIYEVGDLLSEATTPSPTDEFFLAIQSFLNSVDTTNRTFSPIVPATDAIHAGRAVIWQTAVTHERIDRFITAVRHATPDGAGPEIWRGHSRGIPRSTVVRVYDVRDLAGRVRYAYPDRRLSVQFSGVNAVHYLLEEEVQSNIWWFGTQVAISGRLVIEETPQAHEQIRSILHDLRTGKIQQFKGLVIEPPTESQQ